MNRRGQTEDFFADMIIAFVIIAISMLILSALNLAYNTNIEDQLEEAIVPVSYIKSADVKIAIETDMINLLRSPWKDDETVQQAFLRSKGKDKNSCDSDLQEYLDDFFEKYYGKRWVFNLVSIDRTLVSCQTKSPLAVGELSDASAEEIVKTLIPFPLEDGQLVYIEVKIYE